MPAVELIAGEPVLVLREGGAALASVADFTDVVGEALSVGVRHVAVEKARIDGDFFNLSSGLAGEVLQKFVNYRIAVTIFGDLSEELARSRALQAFVRESNRGGVVRFVERLD